MAADGNAVCPTGKVPGLGIGDKRQDHAAEGGVGVQVGVGDGQFIQDGTDLVEIIHRTLHGGADVGKDDGRDVTVDAQGFAKVAVVHLRWAGS